MANVRSVISADYSSVNLSLSKEPPMTPTAKLQLNDPDIHKGVIEGDRPSDEQHSNPLGDGVDDSGLPDDPIATAEDRIGANEDESQG
jgi:hypothetical protein